MTLLPLLLLSTVSPQGRIVIDTNHVGAAIPQGLYGVFLEEINNSTDGGLFSELVQNWGFEDANVPPSCALVNGKLATPREPSFWEGFSKDWTMDWPYVGMGSHPYWTLTGQGSLTTTRQHPLSAASPTAAELKVTGRAALENDGYWGMGVRAGESYDLSAFLNGQSFKGKITAELISVKGVRLASVNLSRVSAAKWTKVRASLKPSQSDAKAKFRLSFSGSGVVLADCVSLMPAKRWNGLPLRADLAKMIADLKPGFIRWPGGCVAEGITIDTRAKWEQTLGPREQRTPTFVPWGYWTSNGFGYHEWLLLCEKLHAEPLYVFNAGISCAFRSGTYLPDAEMPKQIQNTLNAIEYAVGPTTSKYGAMRAKAGHPKPFGMHMVELGNEDQGAKYGARFKTMAAAIKAKYPKIKVILSSWISGIDHAAIEAAGPQLDIVDEHAYTPANWSIQNFDSFGKYPRTVPWELYIGEFATNSGVGRGNMRATLGDVAYMMSMEKNADLVKMGSYAPLLENVHRRQWEVNLIHFDSTRSIGRASYYACKLFAENLPKVNCAVTVDAKPVGEANISGPIGIGTFGTSAEFKDIRVNGKPISGTWKKAEGDWSSQDGVFAQRSREFNQFSYFSGDYANSTIELKARKVDGDEGFVVSVGNADGRRVQFNVGGWGNRLHGLEAEGVIRQVRGTVETGRWYDVKVQTQGRRVICWLDGEQIFDEALPRVDTLLAIAGKSGKTMIVKVLNPSAVAVPIDLDFKEAKVETNGTMITLGSADVNAENSFQLPTKIVPVTRPFSPTQSQTIPANSLAIFRVNLLSH